MLFEDEAPPTSGEEARARRVRPVEERYDPDKLSHWSITMTIAWIVWGDLGCVRQQWNDFREECADWTFYTDPAALAEVGRLALRNLENGEVAPNDPDLDRRLKKGEWRLTPWGPSSWHGLEMTIRSEDMPPDFSIDSLWLAAGEGKLQASGLECIGENDFDGKLVEIPHYLWPRLRRAKEPSGKALLVGPDRVYRDVKFARLDVKELWPKVSSFAADEERPSGETRSKPRRNNNLRGRPPEYKWDEIRTFVVGLVDQFGVPGPSNKKLPRQEDLVIEVQNELAKKDLHPGVSTVRRHVSKWLSEL